MADARPRLVIFSGVPGSGKSTLAGRVATWLSAPVFCKDELEATLWRAGIGRDANSGWAAYDLLTTLACAQLRLGQSAILDSVATYERIRAGWRAVAEEFNAALKIVETICSDRELHRSRIEQRERGIPGWPELSWDDVCDVAARFEPWSDSRLVLDAAAPFEHNVHALREFILEDGLEC